MFKLIYILFSLQIILSAILPIQQVEIIFHQLKTIDDYKIKESKFLIKSSDNINGVIDDDNQSYFIVQIYDMKIEQKSKAASLLNQFSEQAKLIPIKIKGQFEQVDFTFKQPKNAIIDVNQLINNKWSIMIYIRNSTEVLELKFKFNEEHYSEYFENKRALLEYEQ